MKDKSLKNAATFGLVTGLIGVVVGVALKSGFLFGFCIMFSVLAYSCLLSQY